MIRIEGVPYWRHIVTYTLSCGRRRQMVRYSPGHPWVRESVGRELVERFGLEGIRPGSVRITFADRTEDDYG